ncbi:MAG TPA: aminoglycoside phosphotransferase family protein [Acidimicrobiales bacterium]|nr:aminoglycoside phosphotransferase family protein [Acidimicrobiales bacterium]
MTELFGPHLSVEETLVAHRSRLVWRARLDGDLVALKAFTEPHRAAAEAMAMRAAADGGVGVPPVLGEWRVDGCAVLTLGWVEGSPLGSQTQGWVRAGEQLARLHRLPVPPGLPTVSGWEGDWDSDLVRQVPQECARAVNLGLLSHSQVDHVTSTLGPALVALEPAGIAFLHGDMQPEHVILTTAGGVSFIDWGDAGSGDPLWDLAVLVNDNNLDRLEDVLAGYQPEPQLLAHLRANLDHFRALRYLQEATWLAERSFDPSQSLEGLFGLLGWGPARVAGPGRIVGLRPQAAPGSRGQPGRS